MRVSSAVLSALLLDGASAAAVAKLPSLPSLPTVAGVNANANKAAALPTAIPSFTLPAIPTIPGLSIPVITTGSAFSVLNVLTAATPSLAAPTEAAGLQTALAGIWGDNSTRGNFYGHVNAQILAGILPSSLATALASLLGPPVGIDSTANVNPRDPVPPVYPAKAPGDAPYSLSEAQLRAAIYIPAGFTYGAKPPVIFVPGTGVYGGENFAPNLLKLLSGQPYADPVWLNIPGAQLGDAQVNSEYVAYAINYISGISGNVNVSVISWSQGGLDTQWAFTFWPSTRGVVSDFLPVSPDFHGTVEANVLCLSAGEGSLNLDPCDPSVIQQEYDSRFVTVLRARGGADAYVPTTTFYSAFLDEIVEPQQGTLASAYLNDGRGVGVLNVEVQAVCPGQLAGSFYGHAEMLFNPLTAALIVDALTHPGPANLARINLAAVCPYYIAPGLSVADAIATAAEIIIAGIRLLAYLPKLIVEPPLMPYATS